MATVGFFTPLHYVRPSSCEEGVVGSLSCYFSLERRVATVISGDTVLLKEKELSCLCAASKVASYVLLFPITLPLLATYATLRSRHHFAVLTPCEPSPLETPVEIGQNPLEFFSPNEVPPEELRAMRRTDRIRTVLGKDTIGRCLVHVHSESEEHLAFWNDPPWDEDTDPKDALARGMAQLMQKPHAIPMAEIRNVLLYHMDSESFIYSLIDTFTILLLDPRSLRAILEVIERKQLTIDFCRLSSTTQATLFRFNIRDLDSLLSKTDLHHHLTLKGTDKPSTPF